MPLDATPSVVLKPLSFVSAFHEVRPLNPAYVERLRQKVRAIGVKPYPLSVTPAGLLFGGRHRYEAFKAEGITECLMHISEPASLDREAIELNRASEDALPMTFVDYAEMVWRKQAAGVTQKAIADELGWSSQKTNDYANLKRIAPEAWEVVSATLREMAETTTGEVAETKSATADFSERLLREITALAAHQQLDLVQDLAAGRINKNKFRAQAEAYRTRNAIQGWVRDQLGDIDPEIIDEAAAEVARGAYDAEWKAFAEQGTDLAKLNRLVEAARARFAKKHSLILIQGDFHEEIAKLGDASVDAVITDPPYRISTDRIYRLASQADWNKNFGAWDNQPEGEFLADIRRWAEAFFRVMKPGASGFMFVGEPYLNIAQALFDAAGFEIKGSFFWCRSNPGTSVTKADFMPAMDHAIQFVKPGARRTFNYPGEPEGFNWFQSPICGGHERLKTPKGETLHPTQKPEAVIRHLMDLISLPGDLVLDGFMGTGTTGKVARDTGRRFIGIEQDAGFFAAAKARVES
ncbi:DNA modification methylase [Roseicella aquatilis]|nr:DNA modification methylase [Roseicella aquatilis]